MNLKGRSFLKLLDYTEDEIRKLTDEELDDPKVWEAVRKSMTMSHK